MRTRRGIRYGVATAALIIVAAACGDATTSTTQADVADSVPATTATTQDEQVPTTQTPEPAVGVLPEGPSALDDMRHPDFPAPLVDPDAIISGGPRPDGIPPIEDPVFISVIDNLELLPTDEPVVALEINGDARAYPVRIMIWHEIVNDTVGDVPVSITYCPLCNSAVSYKRVINGVETTFGTSGRLFASALVMYDRATESLWTHFDGTSVVGVLAGTELEVLASPLMSWGSFISTYPDGLVLDQTQTGFSRSYGTNPYVGYDNPDAFPFLFLGDVDARSRAMQRIVGIDLGDDSIAVSLDLIAGDDASATPVTAGTEGLVILWEPGQSTALESSSIDGGRDVGSTGVFRPVLEGQSLTFVVDGGVIRDEQTDSTWTVAGVAIDGPLAGSELERVPHLDTFWFAWATYQPQTDLIEAPDAS
jgi:hypothetical protein